MRPNLSPTSRVQLTQVFRTVPPLTPKSLPQPAPCTRRAEPSDREIIMAVMAAHEKKRVNEALQSVTPPGSRSRRPSQKQAPDMKDGGAGSPVSPSDVVSAVLW